jgi:hypothetical protein
MVHLMCPLWVHNLQIWIFRCAGWTGWVSLHPLESTAAWMLLNTLVILCGQNLMNKNMAINCSVLVYYVQVI